MRRATARKIVTLLGRSLELEPHVVDVATPRCISAQQVDGATAFCIDIRDQSRMRPEFRNLLEVLRRERHPSVDAAERREGIFVELPMPDRGPAPDLGFAGVGSVAPDHPLAANGNDPWRHHWGPAVPAPVCLATVDGVQRQSITLYAEDRCFVRLREAVDPDTGEVVWQVRLEAKARELMQWGPEIWVERWLGLWSWLLVGVWIQPDEAASLGWRTTMLHINSDFVNLRLRSVDAARFLKVLRYQRWGEVHESVVHEKVSEQGRARFPWTETLELGRRRSDVQLVLYRKGNQLRLTKNVDPAESFYAPVWEANGWKPGVDPDPFRVEFKLRKKGLQMFAGGHALDFRDPALVCSAEARALAWGGLAWNRRLVLDDNPKPDRRTLDPRWRAVIDAGEPTKRLRQVARDVAELTQQERRAKALREVALGAVKWAACSGVATESWTELGDVVGVLGERLRESGQPEVMKAMGAKLDLSAASKRSASSALFFETDARADFEAFVDDLNRVRGWTLTRVDVFELLRDASRAWLERELATLSLQQVPPGRRGRQVPTPS